MDVAGKSYLYFSTLHIPSYAELCGTRRNGYKRLVNVFVGAGDELEDLDQPCRVLFSRIHNFAKVRKRIGNSAARLFCMERAIELALLALFEP